MEFCGVSSIGEASVGDFLMGLLELGSLSISAGERTLSACAGDVGGSIGCCIMSSGGAANSSVGRGSEFCVLGSRVSLYLDVSGIGGLPGAVNSCKPDVTVLSRFVELMLPCLLEGRGIVIGSGMGA